MISWPPAAIANQILCCPVHREALEFSDPSRLTGLGHGEVYPVVDGIPVLLPDPSERRHIAETDWSTFTGNSGIDFYNQVQGQDDYCREHLDGVKSELQSWLPQRKTAGPSLEIGSGRGVLQGTGGDYVALDYSFTGLRRFIDLQYSRVCGTAERLPFRDGVFSFIFSVAALEHVPNADLAFAEIDRVLKPGGIAYLAPAWHCAQYNCEGISVRPYADLTLRQKLVKLSLPIRKRSWIKAMNSLPRRAVRRALWKVSGGPTKFHFKRLRPDYQHYWISDSDAASRLDSHEGCLFFHSRGYEVLNPGPRTVQQLLCRHIGVVVRKALQAPSMQMVR